MVGGKVDGQNLAGTRSEKPKILFGTKLQFQKFYLAPNYSFQKFYLAVKGLRHSLSTSDYNGIGNISVDNILK